MHPPRAAVGSKGATYYKAVGMSSQMYAVLRLRPPASVPGSHTLCCPAMSCLWVSRGRRKGPSLLTYRITVSSFSTSAWGFPPLDPPCPGPCRALTSCCPPWCVSPGPALSPTKVYVFPSVEPLAPWRALAGSWRLAVGVPAVSPLPFSILKIRLKCHILAAPALALSCKAHHLILQHTLSHCVLTSPVWPCVYGGQG